MSTLFILPSYLLWHYSGALRDIARVWTNFLWFTYHFFSVPLLARTFFAPLRRLKEKREKGVWSLEDIAGVIVTNTVMRLVGAIVRTFVLVVGITALLVVFWGGIGFFLFWIALPVLVPISFLFGVSQLLTP